MPLKRTLASDPQLAPAKEQPASITDRAKIRKVAEKIFQTVGLPPSRVGTTMSDKAFAVMLGMVKQYFQRAAFPDKSPQPVIIEALPAEEVRDLARSFAKDLPDILLGIADADSGKAKLHSFPRPTRRLQRAIKEARNLSPQELLLLPGIAEEIYRSWYKIEPYAIEHRQPQAHERPMLDEAKSFTHDGERYYPLSVAAPEVQAPPSTLLDWIKKETKINGQPVRGYYFAPVNRHFISEESIHRAANRFIKWPSGEPAGPVILGEKRDQTGYIHLPEAASAIGVHHHTLWRWATRGTTPTDKPLDVIKDPASDQLYIRQKDVSALKKLVPRGGLRAGRRSLSTLRPH